MSGEEGDVSSFYDKYGEELGLSGGYEHLFRVLPELSGSRVLDAGCGLGDGTKYLAERGALVTGIDVSSAEIETATERHGEVATFRRMDLREPLEFEDESFDLVVCALTLGHLRDWDHPFSEFHRVLVPGGHVVVHAHHPFVDYLELERGTEEVLGTGATYSGVEAFDRPWGPSDQRLRFYRRPLGEFFRPALAAGLSIDCFVEPGTGPDESDRYSSDTPPRHLLVRYQKTRN